MGGKPVPKPSVLDKCRVVGMEASFIEKCISGEALPDEIDDYVDVWHEGNAGQNLELYKFLGMTWDEYSLWATKPSLLSAIIRARKKRISLRDELNIPDKYEHTDTSAIHAVL